MATISGEVAGKETVVRVKRKRNDDAFESLWLEMAPRAIKRHEPDLTKLSLDEPAAKSSDEGAPTKLLFRRVETMTTSEVKNLFLPDFLKKVKEKKVERARQKLEPSKNTKDKKGQLLAAAKELHEASARTARFQQVWRSRTKAEKSAEEEDPMPEFCRLYDVVRLDMDEELAAKTDRRNQAKREAELREGQLLCNYLPLLREVLPSVAAEIEAGPAMVSEMGSGQDLPPDTKDYVYDVYLLDEKADGKSNDGAHPVIQITDNDDQDFQIDMESDYDSEDSNDANNPNNDYPEEEDQFDAKGESDADSSDEDKINHYGNDDEEYDTVLSDEERHMQRWSGLDVAQLRPLCRASPLDLALPRTTHNCLCLGKISSHKLRDVKSLQEQAPTSTDDKVPAEE